MKIEPVPLVDGRSHGFPDFVDLLVVDDIVPSTLSPFRVIEYRHYLDFFNAAILSTEGWKGWFGNESFAAARETFTASEAKRARIGRLADQTDVVARLAYVTFLGNAYRLLPYFRSRNLPFILQLYPGGGLELNQPEVDQRLDAVLNSPLCRKVIVTQTITERYLRDRIKVDPARIEMIYGGVFESREDFSFDRDKIFYPADKDTIDICFVAHRYGSQITSKGYDRFADLASKLAARFPHVRFHVVGGYLAEDWPLGAAADRFTFHGAQPTAFFRDFHARMDMIVSMNRAFDLAAGAFDGFPTGACIEAGFRGVLNCINDPLDLNVAFADGRDLVLLGDDVDVAVERIAPLLAEPARLYALARANMIAYHDKLDTDRQLWARTRLIAAELIPAEALVVRPTPPPSLLDSRLSGAPYAAPAVSAQAQTDQHGQHIAAYEALERRYGELEDTYRHLEAHYRRLENYARRLEGAPLKGVLKALVRHTLAGWYMRLRGLLRVGR